jgi:hypothetical protein
MGQTIACPRCQAKVDAGGYAPGSSLRCTDCGGLMRVPSGRTGVHAAVPDETSQNSQTKSGTRMRTKEGSGTKMRVKAVGSASETRMRAVQSARRQKSSTGLIVGLLVGVVAIVVVVLVLVQPGSPPPETASSKPPPAPRPVMPKPPAPEPMPAAPAPVPAPADAPAPAPATSARQDDPAKANWDQLMQALRPGGGFDDLSRPEGVAFAKVKRMGKPAYPFLARYIDNEDVTLGRAAVVVLGELTGNKTPLPNDTTKVKIKADWEAWIKANP